MTHALAGCSLLLFLLCWTYPAFADNWRDVLRQFPEVTLSQWGEPDQPMQVMLQPNHSTHVAGTLIILPDQQQHAFYPSWLPAIQQHYPAAGWQVVTLPSRELTVDATSLPQQQNQLLQQLQVLNQQALPRPWLVLAQGEAAALAIHLLSETEAVRFDALISINAFFADLTLHRQLQPRLSDPKIPVLDLLTAYSHPWAQAYAEQRQLYARSRQNPLYRQRLLEDIRSHPAQTPVLVKEILGWQRTMGF